MRIPRRNFLTGALAATLLDRHLNAASDPVAEILARIAAPKFPERTFDVARFGGVGDGRADCRQAFAKAISECHKSGGGRVLVPAGTYLSNGPIHLASNVNLHLADGAKILFGIDPADYLPPVLTRWEGTRCYNYSPLIYANQQENIAITGS